MFIESEEKFGINSTQGFEMHVFLCLFFQERAAIQSNERTRHSIYTRNEELPIHSVCFMVQRPIIILSWVAFCSQTYFMSSASSKNLNSSLNQKKIRPRFWQSEIKFSCTSGRILLNKMFFFFLIFFSANSLPARYFRNPDLDGNALKSNAGIFFNLPEAKKNAPSTSAK